MKTHTGNHIDDHMHILQQIADGCTTRVSLQSDRRRTVVPAGIIFLDRHGYIEIDKSVARQHAYTMTEQGRDVLRQWLRGQEPVPAGIPAAPRAVSKMVGTWVPEKWTTRTGT